MARMSLVYAAMVVLAVGATVWAAGRVPATEAVEEWLAVRETSLVIPRGSPLDFSSLVPTQPAGAQGHAIARPDGSIAYENAPDKPVRFLCASLSYSGASGAYPDKREADLYAEQLRIHGYNIARLHFVDANLMGDRARDFDYDLDQLGRLHYLLAALKRNGIGWIFDAQTSENGAIGGVYPHRWVQKHDLKIKVHFEEEARRHWLRLVDDILGTVNPFTGLRPLDDPALAGIVAFNENGLEFSSILEEYRTKVPYPESLRAPFNAWLTATYGTTAKLAMAWGTSLGAGEELENGTVRLPMRREELGPRMRDLQRFFIVSEQATFRWMNSELRQRGFKGLISSYNNWSTTAVQVAREQLPFITMNTYFDWVASLEPGGSITQTSSLDTDVEYVRNVFGSRWLRSPMFVTEHDHMFWNGFRHESGLVMPAYAAFQSWSGICRHGWGPIDLSYRQPHRYHKQKLLPYSVGFDPIARASETLAALLYLRGDVAPALKTIAVPFGSETSLVADGQGQVPSDLTRLGLLTGFGLTSDADSKAAEAPTNSPRTELGRPTLMGELIHRLPRRLAVALDKAAGVSEQAFAQRVDALAENGLLDPKAARLAKSRVYRSDTGQILLDGPKRLMQLVTPRSEAITFERLDTPQTIGKLTILKGQTPSLVAVSSLDGNDIEASRRLLLIFATDAMNTGQKFSDASRRTVLDFGKLPIVIRRGEVHMRLSLAPLKSGANDNITLRSLRLNGTLGSQLPMRVNGSELEIKLDNATEHGPTTFFVIER